MPKSLRTRLLAGENLVGALVRMPCEEIVEMLAVAGLDFVLIDCEHGPGDVLALRTHIALAETHGIPVLVRPGLGEHPLLLRALDQGAQGIVAPHIDGVHDAQALVSAAHYPPLGERGFATYPRAGRFGTVTAGEHRRVAAEETLLIAMLESPAGVSAAEEILRTPGIDGYLIGVADLAASSGDASIEDSIATIQRAASKVNSRRADLAGSPLDAEKAFSNGASMVIYNVTQVLMRTFGELAAVTDAR